ncbi:SI1L3 protein, partial [Buphagus erythrorhynchus]|nr:SI1L3 protein [Buphagus erythrorhynchus]
MGVRARVAEWPPRSKDSQENSRNSNQSAFKALHRLARRPLQHSKDVEFQEFQEGFPGMALRQRSSSEVTLSECDGEEAPEKR